MSILEKNLDHRRSGSTICTSQYSIEKTRVAIKESKLADAVLHRIFHDAYSFSLKGESMRKTCRPLSPPTPQKTDTTHPHPKPA